MAVVPSSAAKDLGPVLKLAGPSTLGRLWRAGALRPRGGRGPGVSLPWLLGRGPSLGILSRIQGVALGPKPAVIDRHGVMTCRDPDQRSDRVARALETSGGGPGSGVAVLLRNGREFVEVLLGRGLARGPTDRTAGPGGPATRRRPHRVQTSGTTGRRKAPLEMDRAGS